MVIRLAIAALDRLWAAFGYLVAFTISEMLLVVCIILLPFQWAMKLKDRTLNLIKRK